MNCVSLSVQFFIVAVLSDNTENVTVIIMPSFSEDYKGLLYELKKEEAKCLNYTAIYSSYLIMAHKYKLIKCYSFTNILK